MGTFELLIVFAALMAVIALVAIAIDWVGRPLKNRQFVPRIYRYDDELNPDPALFDAPFGTPVPAAAAVMVPHHVAPPIGTPGSIPPVAAPALSPTLSPSPQPDMSTLSEPAVAAEPAQPDPIAASADTGASGEDSIFSDAVRSGDADRGVRPVRGIAQTIPVAAALAWHPGMSLDARVGDRKATVAVKAERYWREAAEHLGDRNHFDETSRALMAAGKAPRRRNPRTGDLEAMELVGLRSASRRDEVRMRWPDDAVDPWSNS